MFDKNSVNAVVLVGKLGKKPELKDVNGIQLCELSLATNQFYYDKKKEEYATVTEWHTIPCWGKIAEKARKFNTGDQIAINGSVRYKERVFDGKDGKIKVKVAFIDPKEITILNRNGNHSQEKSSQG